MSKLMLFLITMSISGSIVFLLTMAVEFLFSKSYMRYMYIAMKLIILFFLIPVTIIVCKVILAQTEVIEMDSGDFSYMVIISLKNFTMLSLGRRIGTVLFFIWIAGFFFFYVISTVKGMHLMKRLFLLSSKVTEHEILNLVETLKHELKIKKKIRVYQNSFVASPFLTGVIHPKIVIPEDTKDKNSLSLMLRHELIHLKSYDVFFKMLLNLIQKIHWFNPIIYIFSKKFFDMSELVCDERVIEQIEEKKRCDYAYLLIEISKEKTSTTNLAIPLKGHSYKIMERRVHRIMQYKKQKITAKFILTMCMLGVAAPTVTYASSMASLQIQDTIIENNTKKIEETQIEQIEYTVQEPLSVDIDLGSILARGSNVVNTTLGPGQTSAFRSFYLKAGSIIMISTFGNPTSERYLAGYELNDNKTYIASSNGIVNHTFTVPKDGTYTIFFQNYSTTKNINIQGNVNIF